MSRQQPKEPSTSRLAEVRAARLQKLQRLRELGVDPYPATFEARQPIGEAREKAPGTEVRVAGRLVLWRRHGGSTFATLRDQSGQVQLQFRRDALGPDRYELLKLLDVGDFIGIEGSLFTTRTGELTVEVRQFAVLTKALRPLPEKWHGLTDPETRVRKRHLTFISDPGEMEMLVKRAQFVHNIRAFLEGEGFVEVATPALERIPGGAEAEPFVTHHAALDTDFYLRISLELAHKRLIVGGFERIYEIGRVFRNEGLGREYLQEFDLLEFYWAYADLPALKRLVERFYATVIQETFGTLRLTYGEDALDFTPPWPETDYLELFRQKAGIDLHQYPTAESLLPVARKLDIPEAVSGLGRGRLIDLIYKRVIRPTLIQPQFLVNHPVDISPLAKRDPKDPIRVQRLQVLIAGSEVGNGFAELNDPLDQRARFEEQQRLREAGDREAQMLDEEFLEALEYGMPPTAGFGVSIERWLMYLTNSPAIRDVVAFPLTRPAASSSPTEEADKDSREA
ncbi:MAG: lysine--tRNA ligase [Chloroflexi bacterium RBG_16_68_14]|nr:MAG: lysine--tRNA ligase [Chloroflexi bacterium RBG_16_68_14]